MAKQTFTTGQVLTAAQMTSLQQTAMGGGSTTAKTTSYVLVAADAGTVVQMNSASATTITVNTALFAAGDTVQIQNVGAGVCTVTAGTATVSTSAVLALKQYDAGSLYFNTTSAAIFFAVDAADGMSNPLTTTGDIIYSSSGTTAARLGIGSTSQVLTVASGIPSWATPATATSGLTFISKTAFTGQTTVNINSVFTSTYANYYLVMDSVNTGATTCDVSFRLRASGTDTTANYRSQRIFAGTTTIGTGSDVLGTDEIWIGSSSISGAPPAGNILTFMSPNEAKRTTIIGSPAFITYASSFNIEMVSGSQSDTTQFDGITFIFGASCTGNIYIYGLQKA
jgi:hypothetical protein